MGTNNLKKEEEFISLKEISNKHGYTQHHLGLLCRQGKLQAKRIGKKWLTTEGWFQKYLKSVEDGYKKNNHYTNGYTKKIEKASNLNDLNDFKKIELPFFDQDKNLLRRAKLALVSVCVILSLAVFSVQAFEPAKQAFEPAKKVITNFTKTTRQNIVAFKNDIGVFPEDVTSKINRLPKQIFSQVNLFLDSVNPIIDSKNIIEKFSTVSASTVVWLEKDLPSNLEIVKNSSETFLKVSKEKFPEIARAIQKSLYKKVADSSRRVANLPEEFFGFLDGVFASFKNPNFLSIDDSFFSKISISGIDSQKIKNNVSRSAYLFLSVPISDFNFELTKSKAGLTTSLAMSNVPSTTSDFLASA